MKDTIKGEKSDLIQSFEESKFAEAVFTQLQKEFYKVGVIIEFSNEELLSFPVFKKRLSEEIELIMRSSSNTINQLLYISDLPEQAIDKIFKTEIEPIETLAEMLLIRISQKIYYREKYKLGLI